MKNSARIDQLIAQVEQAFAMGQEYAYVEVGRYKGYSTGTVRALKERGYRIERRVLGGAYHVFPKPVAPPVPVAEKTYAMEFTEGEIIAIRELARKFPRGNEFADNYGDELFSLDKKTTEKLAGIFDENEAAKKA